jgi:hypothetical protein
MNLQEKRLIRRGCPPKIAKMIVRRELQYSRSGECRWITAFAREWIKENGFRQLEFIQFVRRDSNLSLRGISWCWRRAKKNFGE